MDQNSVPPHVLIFPLPLQGPVNSMFKLAELLCLSGLHVTFLVTHNIHTRLIKYSNIHSRFDRYPGFQLQTISDGLPEHHPRSGPVDSPIKSIPGMEEFFRRRDLPSFCRSGNLSDPSLNLYLPESTENPRAHGLILNTFDDLEGPILSQISTFCPNLYTIGPLHSHLKYKLVGKSSSSPSSNSLWKEDMSCITWLNSQPPKSVLYVSFGSLAVMTKEQYMEFWYGLVNSGSRFLWVIRPDSITTDSTDIPPELSKGTEDRGYIVEWAPQEEVLAHSAVGGFLTHSGWNSTLESVMEGVPMICWPYFLDQQVNSRFVGEVWKLGLDMKDTCDRVIVEKTVRELMEDRKDEFRKSADQMAKYAKQCLIEGGSSYWNLERLIQDIKAM